jgi:membrane protein YdbS with pleckstrin-like domain
MASHYLQSLLGEHEKIILATRHHWFVLARSIILEVFLIIVIFAATIVNFVFLYPSQSTISVILGFIGFALLSIPIITGTRDILIWTNHLYIVTNLRVMQIAGIFNKSVIDSSLDKVNDIKMDQSAMGRMFGYGDIEILTASELGVNQFKKIDDPLKFKNSIINAKAYLEHGDEFAPPPTPAPAPVPETRVDIPAMIAQLAELRKQGILTEDEFQRKKAELLTKI